VRFLTKYRRRFDILADIVRVAGTGAKKTKIMYFANLSFLLLNKYLEDALNVGFLRFNEDQYLMTKKGGTFLQRYKEFSNRYSSVKAACEELEAEAADLERMCRRRRAKEGNARRSRLAILG
jgi:predicted transcriptional regulator